MCLARVRVRRVASRARRAYVRTCRLRLVRGASADQPQAPAGAGARPQEAGLQRARARVARATLNSASVRVIIMIMIIIIIMRRIQNKAHCVFFASSTMSLLLFTVCACRFVRARVLPFRGCRRILARAKGMMGDGE